ncbi:hypothetical protein B296_00010378 [Ensete ventricosum]|uniref:Uncharacterized protein n=1 Tax=Ensete ventricosum TaxID=4639 RepID=A0A426ZKL5_ENSVE|nr:hypothetical protein B296_00010378 [Ensete ventricosum]
MHRVDAVRNSSGVCRQLTEGIGSLLGWRKRVRSKKIETRQKIIRGSRKTYRERCSGISLKFARRFAERIGKLAGNMSGDCWKKSIDLTTRMSEAAELVGGLVFTQRRSVVDAGVPQEGGLRNRRRPLAPNH